MSIMPDTRRPQPPAAPVRRWWLPLAWLFLLVSAAWYIYDNILHELPNAGRSDFTWYYLASRAILHGQSPYVSEYNYPPLLAFLLTPICWLDYLTARWIWFVFSQLSLAAAAWLMWRRLGRDWLAACLIALVWAGGGAAGESFGFGQIGAPLTLVIASAYVWSGERLGAAAGFGGALKLIPGILAMVLLFERQWRGFRLAVAAAVLLTAIPWLAVWAWLPGPKSPPRRDFLAGTPGVLSWSLPSIALRAIDPPRSGPEVPHDWVRGMDEHDIHLPPGKRRFSLGVALAGLTIGLAAMAWAVRGRLKPEGAGLAASALLCLALAVSPVSWTHYRVMLYPAAAFFLCWAARARRWRLFAAALAGTACVYPVPVLVLRAGYWDNGGAWPNWPAYMCFWTSISAAATLLLYGLMLRELRRTHAATPAY